MKGLLLILLTLNSALSIRAQVLEESPLRKIDEEKGIYKIYSSGEFESFAKLILYENENFSYLYESTNFKSFSDGKWQISHDTIILNSKIDSNEVPIELLFFQTDTVKTFFSRTNNHSDQNPPIYSTQFQVPINLKKEFIPDAIIYINNDSTYCFPYFDTCIGTYKQLERIKVNFGNGFKSKWMPISATNFKRVLCIAQTETLFSNYISYKNYPFKINGKRITKIN